MSDTPIYDVEAEFTRIRHEYGCIGEGAWAAAKWYAEALVRSRADAIASRNYALKSARIEDEAHELTIRMAREERDALLADLRKCEQQLIAMTPVSDISPREETLAEALQLVLDDWANGNVIFEDAMEKAERALNLPARAVTHTSHTAVPHKCPRHTDTGLCWIKDCDCPHASHT